MTLERRVRRLEDIHDINALMFRYAEINDSGKDPDAMVSLFTEDGIWQNPAYGKFVGHEAMRAYWTDIGKLTSFSLHYMTNQVVELDDDGTQARCSCYHFGTATQKAQAFWIAIRFSMRCRKTDGRWLFSEMTLNRQFMTPFEVSWAGTTPRDK